MAKTYPRWLLRLFSRPPSLIYRLGLGQVLGSKVLLLTTTGRKTGLPRTTPLQYEIIGSKYYIGSMCGASADWYQNLVLDPDVTLQVGRQVLHGIAEPIDDVDRIFEFIRYRLKKNPRMIGAILRMDGLSAKPSEDELREYARDLTIVTISPGLQVEQPLQPTGSNARGDK
jgi:deazaflavin-dependent oxidoreductase (nitroreductase family)